MEKIILEIKFSYKELYSSSNNQCQNLNKLKLRRQGDVQNNLDLYERSPQMFKLWGNCSRDWKYTKFKYIRRILMKVNIIGDPFSIHSVYILRRDNLILRLLTGISLLERDKTKRQSEIHFNFKNLGRCF